MSVQTEPGMRLRSNSVNDAKFLSEQSLMLGNKSKDAESWQNGPTHMIRKHSIPGYRGFVPGVKSENLIASTYANNTAACYSG